VTAAGTGSSAGSRGRGTATLVGLVVIVVALLVVGSLTANNKSDQPFDPASTSPSGTKALVDLVKGYGTSVDVPDHFPTDADIAVLFEDVVPTDDSDRVRSWVADGHTLVVTDATSDLTPQAQVGSPHSNTAPSSIVEPGTCTIDALAGVGRLDRGPVSTFDPLFTDTGAGSPRQSAVCFASELGSFVVVTPQGKGQIVSIASGTLFTNKYLAQQDNAVLAVDLLAPVPGKRVAILQRDAFGSSADAGGLDINAIASTILTPGVKLFLLELLVAVVVYGIARGRRLGHPVAEPQPVQIAGSELVGAVGKLLQQMKEPGNAGALLRADLRRRLADRLGLPPGTAPEVLAEMIADRTGRSRDDVLAVLADLPVPSERELVVLAQQIDTVREEVLHGHAP
jgi:hypothetical protein